MKEVMCKECNSALIRIGNELECQYCGGNDDYTPIIEEEVEEDE